MELEATFSQTYSDAFILSESWRLYGRVQGRDKVEYGFQPLGVSTTEARRAQNRSRGPGQSWHSRFHR